MLLVYYPACRTFGYWTLPLPIFIALRRRWFVFGSVRGLAGSLRFARCLNAALPIWYRLRAGRMPHPTTHDVLPAATAYPQRALPPPYPPVLYHLRARLPGGRFLSTLPPLRTHVRMALVWRLCARAYARRVARIFALFCACLTITSVWACIVPSFIATAFINTAL